MIRYLIKNNFKLMLRNKWVVIVMLLGPILVIAMLSAAFGNMMATYEKTGNFKVGYRIDAGSVFEENIEDIKKAGSEAGIDFFSYPDGDIQKIVEKNDLAGFLVFADDSYTVYENADDKNEGKMLEYFMEQVNRGIDAGVRDLMFPETTVSIDKLPAEKLSYMPAISSIDYYGIIEVVYFSWLGIVSVAGVFASEKKNGIEKRFELSGISSGRLYFARWIPAVALTACEMAVTAVLSSFLFGVSWGGYLQSARILLLTIMAAISVGMLLYYIFRNFAVTVIALFTMVWFMGFFGGSFETYMFSSQPESLKRLSAIYYVNRALVEYSCMGHSDYAVSSMVYVGAVTVICTVLALLVSRIRKGGEA